MNKKHLSAYVMIGALTGLSIAFLFWRHGLSGPPAPGPIAPNSADATRDRNVALKPMVIHGNADDPEHHFVMSRQKFLAAFPPEIARNGGVTLKTSAPGVWMMELLLRGKRVMATDVRITQSADGSWAMRDFVPPPMPANVPDFPPIDGAALERFIRATLNAEGAQIQSVQLQEPLWVPQSQDTLRACANFQVNYNAKNGDLHREMWCVQPDTQQIFLRASTIRN